MEVNPILAAKLEFLATAMTGVAANYACGKMTDDEALEAAMETLEAFVAPIAPEEAEPSAASASA